jgi:lysyl-tRNA synthetase class I
MMSNNNNQTREVRNMAAALYVHAGGPEEEVDLQSIMKTAEGCVAGINELLAWLENNPNATEEQIQFEAYECGKRNLPVSELRLFFSSIYLMLLGRPEGPRIGITVALTGSKLFVQKIRERMSDPFGWLKTTQTVYE